ncbi:uncharacterized protein K02A2.6-like [Macrosteles quadrilineatus]|uniref:uncharacterized protein K02A2.6-like n=1 Tax=Macrosteles quadrilineatus TaxID=74068 RepID=UPI0023E0FBEB|nr:uncharacterized protein K02A2.6-like [Macrosteles quadrilineatus]
MTIADTLSRAAVSHDSIKNQEDIETYQVYQITKEDRCFKALENIDSTQHLNVTPERLKQMKDLTAQDVTLRALTTVITAGWPRSKEEVSAQLREYWNFRDELVAHDGLVFRGNRLVVPITMRKEMLKRIHSSHPGLDASLRKAREALYWPRMSEDIKQNIEQCSACLLNSPNQPHMPMQTHEVPDLPWQRVAMDIFTLRRKNYLVTIDYYSDFWELDELEDTTSSTLIEISKKNFSRWGIPKTLVTDNANNFISEDWTKFAKEWEFSHVTSSPYHARGNAKAEATVKIAKKTLKRLFDKAEEEDIDIWLAILEWRNTESKGVASSPVQRIMSRRTRSLVPMKSELFKPYVQTQVRDRLIKKKQMYKYQYDRSSRHLPDLEIGQGVAVKTKPQQTNSKWAMGTVVSKPSSRSYIIKTPEGLYRRNREMLKPSPSPKCSHTAKKSLFMYDTPFSQSTEHVEVNEPIRDHVTPERAQMKTTRSGRLIKTPERYKH